MMVTACYCDLDVTISLDSDGFFTFQNIQVPSWSGFLPFRPLARTFSNSAVLYHSERALDHSHTVHSAMSSLGGKDTSDSSV